MQPTCVPVVPESLFQNPVPSIFCLPDPEPQRQQAQQADDVQADQQSQVSGMPVAVADKLVSTQLVANDVNRRHIDFSGVGGDSRGVEDDEPVG